MEHKLFTFWLDGFFKGVGSRALAENEVKLIRGELEKAMNPVAIFSETGSFPHLRKPDYFIGSPDNPIPMFDEYNKDGTKKSRLIC